MPVYEYLCEDCGYIAMLQLKIHHQTPSCLKCGSSKFHKQISSFQVAGLTAKSASPTQAKTNKSKESLRPASHDVGHSNQSPDQCSESKKSSPCSHSHSQEGSHDHSHSSDQSSCSSSKIDDLLRRYDKQNR